MTPYELQVLDAMLRQNGAIPQGPATMPPNFTMPGAGPQFNPNILSGEGIVPPVSGNLPAVIPQSNVPAIIPQGPINNTINAAPNAAQALGGGGAEVPPEVPPAVASAEGAAPEAGGLMSRVGRIAKFLRPAAVPFALSGLALSNDPGKLPEENNPGYPIRHDSLAAALNPSPDDTGAIDLIKGVVRGTAKAGMVINDFLTKPKSAKEKPKASEPTSPQAGGPQPTIDEALGLSPTGGANGKAGGTITAPGIGRNPIIDALEGNMIANKPGGYAGSNEGIHQEMIKMAEEEAQAANPAYRGGARALVGEDAARKKADIQYKMSQAALALGAQERQEKWAMDAAKMGSDLEKEQHEMEKDSLQIHMSKGHAVIVSKQLGEDGKPMNVIQPLDDAYFGVARGQTGQIDPHQSVTVMGQKFANLDKDPFAKQAMLLGNVQKDGQLSDVMNMPDVAPLMKAADMEAMRSLTGLGEEAKPEAVQTAALQLPKAALAKAQVDARRGVLFHLMVAKPDFQQKLINMQVGLHQLTRTPMGTRFDQDGGAPAALNPQDDSGPDLSDDDYLTQLQAAQGK